jgi:hypothetical protein
MRMPLRALKTILLQRRALAQKEQHVLSRMLDALPELASNGFGTRRPAQKSRARKPIVCRRCNRRFALPMHLGRHMAMSHKRRRAA